MLVRSAPIRMLAASTRAHTRPVAALLASSLLVLAFLATARNAQAADGMPALETAAIAPPPADGAPAPLQDAVTDQTSSATGTVAQPDQSNVIVIIRINSPGDDVVSPTNVIAVGATSTNDSTTNQEQAAGTAPAAAAAQADDTTPTVSAAPASQPAAHAEQNENERAPAGKVILAAYGPASVSTRAEAPARAPAGRHAEPARRSGAAARPGAEAPSRQAPAPAAKKPAPRPAQVAATGSDPHASSTGAVQRQLAKVLGGGRT